MELRVKRVFEASHFLPHLPEHHRCRRLHGHRYEVEVGIACTPDPVTFMGPDYDVIIGVLEDAIALVDHRHLNDLPFLPGVTTEALCSWFVAQLKPDLPSLAEVRIQESVDTSCTIRL